MNEINDRAYFSSMGTAMVIEVVLTTLTKRGTGKPGENSPIRLVTQYWSKKGDLLAERDSFNEQAAIINDLGLRLKLADDANQSLRAQQAQYAGAAVCMRADIDQLQKENLDLGRNAKRQIARLKAQLKREKAR